MADDDEMLATEKEGDESMNDELRDELVDDEAVELLDRKLLLAFVFVFDSDFIMCLLAVAVVIVVDDG